jgi:hypothetical protein
VEDRGENDMKLTPEVESLRLRLDRARTGANAHTVNKAMSYLGEGDRQKSVITRAKLIAACEQFLSSGNCESLDRLMKGWW